MNEEIHQQVRKPSLEESSQALIFKQKGNQFFKAKNYEEALSMYELAIQKDPTNSIYFSNKSRCLFNLNRFQQSLEAAETGIRIDQKNIKAHYLAAESLVQISEGTHEKIKIQAAIQRLKRCKHKNIKALALCPSQGKNEFQRNFIDKINRAKKKLWEINYEQDSSKKKAIRKYLVHLVETDQTINEQTKDELNQKILDLVQDKTAKDFNKVPPALICPISKKLIKDPVCNEHGHSYSREAYIQYLSENGGKDPITKKEIKKMGLMYPNINVKKAVEIFLQQNPWIYDQVVPLQSMVLLKS